MRHVAIGVGVLGSLGLSCGAGVLATVPYLSPPASRDGATGFGAFDRAKLDIVRSRRDRAPAAAPIALTASDGTGLALRAIRARGVIEGPLAVTELRLDFQNTEDRQREGRFTIALPDGAAVSRLAMKIEGKWMEGEVVPRPRARTVFESHLQIAKDPALLERDAGNVFSARIFPIEAKQTKQLIVTYSQELGAATPYRLHLAGLPVVDELDVEVTGGEAPVAVRGKQRAPIDVVIPSRGAAAVIGGTGAVIRIAPALETPADPVTDLTILVDTSASRGADLRAQGDAIRDLVRALEGRGLTWVQVAAFDQTVTPIAAGAPADVASGIGAALIDRGALGASDLEAALAWAGKRGQRVLVVTDGIATAGATEPTALAAAARGAARVDALVLGGRGDRDALRAIVAAGARPGMVLGDDEQVAAWLDRLSRQVAAGTPIKVRGARWVWPETVEAVQPGDDLVIAAHFDATPDKQLEVVLGDAPAIAVHGKLAPIAFVERAVASAEIARRRRGVAGLAGNARDKALGELTQLAVEHRLLTDETALLVLENDAMYASFCLSRTALADIIAVDRGKVSVISRGLGATIPSACTPEQEAASTPNGDWFGVSFSGSSSLENSYFVDGVNTTSTTQGSSSGEVITIAGSAPIIDQGSTALRTTYDARYGGTYDFRGPPLPLDWQEGPSAPSAPKGGRAAVHGNYAFVTRYIRAGRTDLAIEEALRWQTREPGDVLAVIALGEALEAGGHGALAARAYGSIIDLYPRRAELVRAAGQRLERIGGAAAALAIDAYRRAVADRPDQATGHRLLAWALVRKGDLDGALDVIVTGLERARWDAREALRGDFALVAAAAIARAPSKAEEIGVRARQAGAGLVAREGSVRFVLHWETDASDLDLHVLDRKQRRAWPGHPYFGKSTGRMPATTWQGWGPEVFELTADEATGGPYRLAAHLNTKGPQGHVLGTLQVIEHDGRGGFLFDHRPFVITEEGAYVDLGTWR